MRDTNRKARVAIRYVISGSSPMQKLVHVSVGLTSFSWVRHASKDVGSMRSGVEVSASASRSMCAQWECVSPARIRCRLTPSEQLVSAATANNIFPLPSLHAYRALLTLLPTMISQILSACPAIAKRLPVVLPIARPEQHPMRKGTARVEEGLFCRALLALSRSHVQPDLSGMPSYCNAFAPPKVRIY